jgi:hypothetical protein
MSSNRWTEDQLLAHMAKRNAQSLQDSDHEPDDGPESKLQKRIVKLCKENNWPCLSFPQAKLLAKYIYPGWSDQTIIIPEQKRLLLFELKDGKGRQSPEQKQFNLIARLAGLEYHLVRSFTQALNIIHGGSHD